ncbi:hypothetical protein SAZ11_41280 [Streptomyces sp. FXJ1.4098]|nr:hypothetical protein [Streptomyces sp. FXJ1.4098]
MARGIATRAPVGGHTVTVTAKDPAKAARLAGELGAHARNPPTNTATGYGDGMTLSRVPASPTYRRSCPSVSGPACPGPPGSVRPPRPRRGLL